MSGQKAAGGSSALPGVAASALIGGMFMGSTLVTPLYAIYAERFDFSKLMLTLIYGAYVVGNLAALLLFGRASDVFGRRRTALPAIGVGVVSTLVFLFARSTAWLFAARMISGLAIGVATAAGTAWLVDIAPDGHRASAALSAATANFVGSAVGPLLAGILAEYAPAPLRLSYVVYLVLILVIAALVASAPASPARRDGHWSPRPRIGVAKSIRGAFVAPAITAFCTFAFVGFYAALAPSLIDDRLHRTSHALGGAVVFELFFVGALANLAGRRLSSRAAMLTGLAVQLPALAALVAADRLASLPMLLGATAIAGTAAALGYRGSQEIVDALAPAGQRGKTVASYMVASFIGNSLPVIGIALLAAAIGSSVTARTIFAAVVAVLATLGFIAALRDRQHLRSAGRSPT